MKKTFDQTVVNKVTVNFTMVGNDALRDERLSWGAVGLLAYMLSHTGTWQFRSNAMKRPGYGSGRDAVRRMMRELEAAGYLEHTKQRNGKGQLRTVTVVHYPPLSLATPGTETPAPGRPAPGKAAPIEDQLQEDHLQALSEVLRTSGCAGRTLNHIDPKGEDMPRLGEFEEKVQAPRHDEVGRDLPGLKRVRRKRKGESTNPLWTLATYFREETAHQLVRQGKGLTGLVSMNQLQMCKELGNLYDNYGWDTPYLKQVIDQWLKDIRSGTIKMKPGIPAWSIFKTSLDGIIARMEQAERERKVKEAPAGSLTTTNVGERIDRENAVLERHGMGHLKGSARETVAKQLLAEEAMA